MISPFLLPEDGRKKVTIMGKVKDGTIGRLEDSRYTTSMMDLISMLEGDSASSVLLRLIAGITNYSMGTEQIIALLI